MVERRAGYGTVIASQATRDALKEKIERLGCARVAQMFGIARQTLERATGGLTVQKGTAAMLDAMIASRANASVATAETSEKVKP